MMPENAALTLGEIPPDPPTPGDARKEREAFARALQRQFETWAQANDCCGLDACTLVAQWMLESNWGRSGLSRDARNLGGVKGEGPDGSVEMETLEEIGGKKVTVKAKFRKYGSYPAYFKDYCNLIYKNERYRDARGKRGEAYYQALKKAGYATDSSYVELAMKLFKQLCG